MRKSIYALIDCNNFYVSCERVFNPKLANIPVMVLSNNDGCVVARSSEVKAFGIKMAIPAFKCKDLIKKHNIRVFSSNYTLYADMSKRVMNTLQQFTPDIEIYSIDEAFLSFSNLYVKNLKAYGQRIKNTVQKWTGIPVSIGIASTKVLAKAANELAKKDSDLNGVLDFTRLTSNQIDKYLEEIDLIDIWGIGRSISRKLNKIGIKTAKDLKYADSKWIRRKTSVQGERISLELRGIPCFRLDQYPKPNKSIISSRSFGKAVTRKADLSEAISMYVARAAEKLRSQGSFANIIIVYITTNRFKDEPQYSNAAYLKLPAPTSSTIDLTKYAQKGLARIFKSGFKYKKAGVILEGIQDDKNLQQNFFNNIAGQKRATFLMKAIDKINNTFGQGTLRLASEGIKRSWRMKRSHLSKRYTTNWNELLVVK